METTSFARVCIIDTRPVTGGNEFGPGLCNIAVQATALEQYGILLPFTQRN